MHRLYFGQKFVQNERLRFKHLHKLLAIWTDLAQMTWKVDFFRWKIDIRYKDLEAVLRDPFLISHSMLMSSLWRFAV